MKQRIAIVGAGICGLCTALSLARLGNRVTIFERDVPPPEGDANETFFKWKRRGAAQFRHPHAFLGLMCSILSEHYPDLVEDFWRAGARKVSFADMVPPDLLQKYRPESGDEKIWMLMCRRATMETVLRHYVERQANIEIINSTVVSGLLAARQDEIPVIRGLKLSRRGQPDVEYYTDVVIDASGHTSKFTHWLADLGSVIEQEKHDAEIVYYTRHFKLLAGIEEPARHDGPRSAGDLGYMKFGVFPGEGGHFAVIICLPVDEIALRDAVKTGEKFDEIARTIPGLRRWVDAEKAVATTPSFGFTEIHAVWNHFVNDGKPAALNFFAVGDCAIRTNPLYGRGCSTGIKHAHILGQVLDEVPDPQQRALLFDARSESEMRPIYKASLREDQRGIRRARAILEGNKKEHPLCLKKWFRGAMGDAIGAASRDQMHVFRGIMRTFNLLEPPGSFLKSWPVRLTILRYLLRGRKRNAAAPLQHGPSREQMVSMLREEGSN